MPRTVRAADLFCGAGGSSSGLASACSERGRRLDLTAINHWQLAVETHALNHPKARHFCEAVDSIDPKKAIPGGRLDLLWASPECTHHSTARGGKPVNDQSRASAWCVLRWLTALQVDALIVENVPEFRSWGPLGSDGRPLKRRKGETFDAWIRAIESLGYRTDWRVLNAADYGDPTTRQRLFVQAVRGRRAIQWPNPTHSAKPEQTLFGLPQRWRAAREVIDWTVKGTSIFGRKRPLSPNTLKRIEAGLRKFGGAAAEPFLVLLNGGGRQGAGGAQSIDRPVPVITAGGQHIGVCEPFVLGQQSGAVARSTGEPLPTVTTGGAISLVEPFIVPQFGESSPRSVDRPLGTITTTSRGVGLVQPFLVPTNYGERPGQTPRHHDLEAPMPTVVGTVTHALVEPFVMPITHQGGEAGRCRAVGEPIPTLTCSRELALIEPFLCSAGGPNVDARPVSEPCNTVLTRDHMALCEPFLVNYHGRGQAHEVDEPLRTVDTNDRYGLVQPVAIDILFRMLTPAELARAMSFPDDYQFCGNREAVVKQIGNAVPRLLAQRLSEAVLFGAA